MCREMKEMPFLRQVVRKYSLKYGVSTSGKSADFGSAIPRFESWHPSQYYFKKNNDANSKQQIVFGVFSLRVLRKHRTSSRGNEYA